MKPYSLYACALFGAGLLAVSNVFAETTYDAMGNATGYDDGASYVTQAGSGLATKAAASGAGYTSQYEATAAAKDADMAPDAASNAAKDATADAKDADAAPDAAGDKAKKEAEEKKKKQDACDAATEKAAKNPSTASEKNMEDKCKMVGVDIATPAPQSIGGPSMQGTDVSALKDFIGPRTPAQIAAEGKLNTNNFGGGDFIGPRTEAQMAAETLKNDFIGPRTQTQMGNELLTVENAKALAEAREKAGFGYNTGNVNADKALGIKDGLLTVPSTGNAELDKMVQDTIVATGGLKQVTAADVTKATGLKGAQADNVARMVNMYSQGKNPDTEFGKYLESQGIKLNDMDAQQALVKSGLESGIGRNTSSVTADGRVDKGTYNHFSPGEIERIRDKYKFPYTYNEIMSDPAKEAQFALVQTHDLNEIAKARFTAAGLSSSDTYNGMNMTQYAYSLNTGGSGISMKTAAGWYNTGSQVFVGNVARNGAQWTNVANNALTALSNGSTFNIANIPVIGSSISNYVGGGGVGSQLTNALNNINVGGVSLGSILGGSGTSNVNTNTALAYLISSGLFNNNSGGGKGGSDGGSGGGGSSYSDVLGSGSGSSTLNTANFENLKGYDIAMITQKCGDVPVSQASLDKIRAACTY